MVTDPLARHATHCNAPLVLCVETRWTITHILRPPHWQEMVVERCQHCGRLVNWWGVVERDQ